MDSLESTNHHYKKGSSSLKDSSCFFPYQVFHFYYSINLWPFSLNMSGNKLSCKVPDTKLSIIRTVLHANNQAFKIIYFLRVLLFPHTLQFTCNLHVMSGVFHYQLRLLGKSQCRHAHKWFWWKEKTEWHHQVIRNTWMEQCELWF